jgi:hypothetical protein
MPIIMPGPSTKKKEIKMDDAVVIARRLAVTEQEVDLISKITGTDREWTNRRAALFQRLEAVATTSDLVELFHEYDILVEVASVKQEFPTQPVQVQPAPATQPTQAQPAPVTQPAASQAQEILQPKIVREGGIFGIGGKVVAVNFPQDWTQQQRKEFLAARGLRQL